MYIKVKYPPKECDHCKQIFIPNRKDKKFCCRQCKQHTSAIRNEHWKRRTSYSYKKYKKCKCEFCGFKPIHKCQLDVDHIDGNHENNNSSNLQTLCANCHRLKTFLNKEGFYK